LRIPLTPKLMAIILSLSLVPIVVVSYISIFEMNQMKSDMRILYDENLVVVSDIADAEASLLTADVSFRQYILEFGTPMASSYYNEMFDRQGVFSQFLIDFRTGYTFEMMPGMLAVIEDMAREDLIDSQKANLRSLQISWNEYVNWTAVTIELQRDDLLNESVEARKNATAHLEDMMDDLEDLIGNGII
jgi:hypothetical protein